MSDLERKIGDAIADGKMSTSDADAVRDFARFLRECGPPHTRDPKQVEAFRRWLPWAIGEGEPPEEQPVSDPVLRTPDEWSRITGWRVLDPDGWRGRDGRPWTDPISVDEWNERLAESTAGRIGLADPS